MNNEPRPGAPNAVFSADLAQALSLRQRPIASPVALPTLKRPRPVGPPRHISNRRLCRRLRSLLGWAWAHSRGRLDRSFPPIRRPSRRLTLRRPILRDAPPWIRIRSVTFRLSRKSTHTSPTMRTEHRPRRPNRNANLTPRYRILISDSDQARGSSTDA